MKIIEKTPEVITPTILELAEKLGATEVPRYVPVVPSPDSEVRRCYLNVDRVVAVQGGAPVEGWLIWEEAKHRWLMAIHHCVWRTPQDELVDVTRQEDGEARIVLAPGGRRWDRVHPVANVYHPLVYDRTVRRFCEVQNDIGRWLERNTQADVPYEPDYRLAKLANEMLKLECKL